ncbi:MAG: hypothetical protein GTN93_27830 [Anaerolineae bacterium]|nr:hypothetical protein [Anaerolineae bacterium]NIQ81819.1 hypothetical protein [Anaerolineae bacterium]
MSMRPFRVLSVISIVLLMVTSCAWESNQFYDNGVSDEEYVSIARVHPDAQAFLEKYPEAETYVDRSGRLAVDFRVTDRPVSSTTQHWEGIRLHVFIDPKTNQPTETFVQCNDRIIKNNVQQYLEQYFTTGTCP